MAKIQDSTSGDLFATPPETVTIEPVGAPKAKPKAVVATPAPVEPSDVLVLPDVPAMVLAALDTPDAPNVEPSVSSVPYLCFFHAMSGKAGEMMSVNPQVAMGDAFVIAGEEITPLANWTFTVLRGRGFWADIAGDTGDITDGTVVFTDPGRKSPLEQQVTTAMLVDTGERIFATLTNWRSAKCRAPLTHMRALEAAALPAWITSPGTEDERKLRAAVVATTGRTRALRVWSTVRLTTRTSKSSGHDYQTASATPACVSLPALSRIGEWLQGEGVQELQAVLEAYNDRIALVESKQ